jgi:hypothetical protein
VPIVMPSFRTHVHPERMRFSEEKCGDVLQQSGIRMVDRHIFWRMGKQQVFRQLSLMSRD